MTGQDGGAELDDRLTQRRDGSGHARREDRAGDRESGTQQHGDVPAALISAPPARQLADRATIGGAGIRLGVDPLLDPVKAVGTWLHLIRGSTQRGANILREIMRLTRWTGIHNYSCSSAARSAAMPRAVWLLTAPRLIRIVAAISASERSA